MMREIINDHYRIYLKGYRPKPLEHGFYYYVIKKRKLRRTLVPYHGESPIQCFWDDVDYWD